MTTPVWVGGKLYLPGDLVRPVTQPTAVSTAITNAGFETGDATGWTLGGGMSVTASVRYSGTYSLECTGSGGETFAVHAAVTCAAGQSITANCMYRQGSASAGENVGGIGLRWLTSADLLIRQDLGNVITSGSGGEWKQSIVSATAPAGTGKVQIIARTVRDDAASSYFDSFVWNYQASTIPPGLIYKAVQTDPGTSGSAEPVWPLTLGNTVVDGGVTWEAVQTSRVVWEASHLLVSGGTEPDWPTVPGAFVQDGSINWECVSRRVEDENCPNSKVVLIVASKVFAADGDIVRYSATANPLDWTTADDAGFLPTGLQQANANDMAVANQYRGNAVFFNASSFQNWQADPDPAAMAILDQMDGVGSVWQQAAQPVANDLFYLSQLGVRSIGIANATENLSAGDVGMPIDELVHDAVNLSIANSINPIATYYPSAGQYWLVISEYPVSALSIVGNVPNGYVGDVVTGSYVASGGVAPRVITVLSGTFPPGLTLAPSGAYTGTYTTAGLFEWVVLVTDAVGNTAQLNDSALVEDPPPFPEIIGTLPSGEVGIAYAGQLEAISGVPPYSNWRIVSGGLPPGLSFADSGSDNEFCDVTGTPT